METAVPADGRGPVAARAFVRACAVPAGALETTELLTSELVTFCIRHAGEDPDARVLLRLERRGDLVRVEACHPGRPGHGPEGGHTALALGIIDGLAPRWGVLRDGEGWSGWFEVGA
ncbi:MAG: ATP-binding protein [Actinomycetota bacterium]